MIDVATQSSSQWTLKQWAEYVRTGVDPTGNSSKVYNIISLEITGTELAKRVKAPRLVREIDWVDNFWHFPGGKGNVVDEKKQAAIGADLSVVPPILPDSATTPDGKPKGKAPSVWPKVQLYCLVRHSKSTQLISDGHERIMDRLARRFRSEFGLLYNTFRIQGLFLHPTYREESEGI